jgi:hypothetical protein
VIYVGSFSKTLFPALRLGFVIVPSDLRDRLVAARAAADQHPPTIDQAVFSDSGSYYTACSYAAVARGRHRVSRRDLIVTVPMLLLALWALRNIAVAPLIGLPVVARAFAVDHDAPERFSKTFLAAATAAIVLVGVLVGVSAAGESNFAVESYPVQSMRYVAHHDLLGSRIFTDDADAGFVILAYSPEQRVFLDDRYDMYPTKLINDYFTVSAGLPGWSRALDRYDTDVVVWARHTALSRDTCGAR